MSQAKDIQRFAKGGRAALSDLKIVLHPDSILCPDCHDDPGDLPCLRCMNVGFIIPEVRSHPDNLESE